MLEHERIHEESCGCRYDSVTGLRVRDCPEHPASDPVDRRLRVVYEPRGAALEYSPLAANLYRGCSHGCLYCYAPAVLRMSREAFTLTAPRRGVIDNLRKDALSLARKRETGPILLCFTCDPYQPIEADHQITRQAIEILGEAGMAIRLLTKNPRLAVDRDLELLKKYRVDFGITCLFTDEAARAKWEPGASTIADRIDCLALAKEEGLSTWMSVEPVIDPAQALAVIDTCAPLVTTFKVGKLNHDKAREAAIDWPGFLDDALRHLSLAGSGYYIKDDLWAYADEDLREIYPKSREAMRP